MNLPLLAIAAAGALGLTLAAPGDAQAGRVNVDIHFRPPLLPHAYAMHQPPRTVYVPAPVVVVPAPRYYYSPHYPSYYYPQRYRAYNPHRGYAGDQWDHGYYDQRRGAHGDDR